MSGGIDATFRPGGDGRLQLLAGLRVLNSSQESRSPILPDPSSDVTRFDPVVGAQGTWPLGERFGFRLRGDVGGPGVDGKLTSQGFGVLGREFGADGVDDDLRLSGCLSGFL